MVNVVVGINLLLGGIITGAVYPAIGVVYVIICAIIVSVGYNSNIGMFLVTKQMSNWAKKITLFSDNEMKIFVSVACLSIGLQIGAAITLAVEVGAIIMLAFCILLACGYFFEGGRCGITPVSSVAIARIAIKAFSLLQITFDRIAEWIAKLEIELLKKSL